MSQKPSYEELENRVKELELIVFGTTQFDEGLLSILSEAEKLANFGSWEWDMVRDTWTMSDNWLKIHGYTGKVLTTEELLTIAYPDDINRIQEAFNQCINNGKPYEIEHRIIKQDTKEVRYIRAFGRIQDDSTGKPVKLYGVAQDITEYKRQEVELKKSEEQYRSLVERTPDLVTMVDSEGRIVFVNHAAQNVYGLSPQECLGRSAFDFIHPEDRDATVASFNDWLRCPDNVLTYENRIANIDGQRKYHMAWMILPERDESGSIIGFSGTARDITDQKRSEEALTKRNKDLQLAQRIAKVGNWTLDPEVGVPEWTDEVYRIYERDPELGPYSLAEYKNIYKGEWFEKFTSAIQRAIHEGQPYDIELKLELAPDNVRWVNAICEPEQNPGLKGYYLRGTIQDITERKQVEQERQELESQLRQKYKMEAVGVMAGGMAHNFNNNLAIILGNLELSKVKLPPQNEVGEYLEYAKIAAMRSRDLVKKIMTYSRTDVPSQVPLQLSLLLKEILSLLKSTIPSSVKLQHEANPDCDQIYIRADSSQIQECLLNLCNNAVHSMEEQGELLLSLERVQLKQEDISPRYDCLPGEYLCLSVQDTGCGIPSEIQDKIFDPFFTTKELYDGTGMGLSTVQGIVEQHHGMIRVTSGIGQGTIFQLYFPVVDPQQKDAVAVAEVELQSGSEKILYVDDDEMIANLNERLLSEMGYQVTIMTDSVEALKHFRANVDRYDLVMTDQTMPELTGKELIQKIKQLRPEMPTILCTGYSSKVNEEDARQAGISAFLMKPTDFAEMSQVIKGVLEKPSIQ